MAYHGTHTKAYIYPYVCVCNDLCTCMDQALTPFCRSSTRACRCLVLMGYSWCTHGVITGYLRRTHRVPAASSRCSRGVRGRMLVAYGVACRLQLRPRWPQAARRPPPHRRAVLPRAPHAGRQPPRVFISVFLSIDVHGKMFTDMPTTHHSPASPTGARKPSTENPLSPLSTPRRTAPLSKPDDLRGVSTTSYKVAFPSTLVLRSPSRSRSHELLNLL